MTTLQMARQRLVEISDLIDQKEYTDNWEEKAQKLLDLAASDILDAQNIYESDI